VVVKGKEGKRAKVRSVWLILMQNVSCVGSGLSYSESCQFYATFSETAVIIYIRKFSSKDIH